MSLTSKQSTYLSVAAIVLLEIFQLAVGAVALFVFGGRTSGVEKLMLFIPLFSFPILILAIRKIGVAMWLMWILFAISHVWYMKISWPKWEALYVMLKLDWPTLMICLILTFIYFRGKSMIPVPHV